MGTVVLSMEVDPSFDLEKVVCSHGFFMMAPNQWLSSSRTLCRPLRLSNNASVNVRISQPDPSPSSPEPLTISILDVTSLSQPDQEIIMVARMLRISEEEDARIASFHVIHPLAKEKGFGRVFRSPTLFEDMVKCILLCNCQWTRTLAMVRALCDLQVELNATTFDSRESDILQIIGDSYKKETISPKAPRSKERNRKRRRKNLNYVKASRKSLRKESQMAEGTSLLSAKDSKSKCTSSGLGSDAENNAFSPSINPTTKEKYMGLSYKTSNFPCPEELFSLDEDYLNRRCNLGYRANRIIKLAKLVVEERLAIDDLNNVDGGSTSHYEQLQRQLIRIDGFGPFTCAYVLMCMGFYHKVPADSETLRHLEQFHGKNDCTTRTIQKYIDDIYGRYSPFQFLAYWFEIWGFYERQFGKLNLMLPSEYHLITGSILMIEDWK